MAKKKQSRKRSSPTASVTEIARAILEDKDRLHEGVDHCLQHQGGKRWREWETEVRKHICIHTALGDACLRYAQEIIQGRWEELENELLSNLVLRKYLLDYLKSGVVSSPCKTLQERLLNTHNASATVYVYARWVLGKPWPSGEEIILRDLQDDTQSLLWWDMEGKTNPTAFCAIEYALHIKNGSWTALERKVEHGKCTPQIAVDYAEKVRSQPMPQVEQNLLALQPRDDLEEHKQVNAIKHYAKVFAGRVPNLLGLILMGQGSPQLALKLFPLFGITTRLKPFETLMFGMPPSAEMNTTIITYTKQVFPRRWKQAEKYLFAQHKDDRFRDAVILYAEKVIKGRWPRIETHLQNCPRSLLQYADRVLKGRLPDHLHNKMVLEACPPYQTRYHERYIEKYGV
jgi:hypothetical protein